MLEFLALLLAAAALLWLRSLSRRLQELQRRIDEALPEPERPGPASRRSSKPAPEGPKRPVRTARQGIFDRFKRHRDVARMPTAPAPRPNWMVWVGGTSVALAGVFLVNYSIEHGLLTPWARVMLGTATGLTAHGAAEWLIRRTGQRHPAWSALAAGGSLTLSAAALAALHLYNLVSPPFAFAFLAVVSLATMMLALRHGPVLAALGLVGCYAVPLLVGGDGDQIVEVMTYSLVVTTAILLMVRYAYGTWLWRGAVGGSLLWWLLSTSPDAADAYRGIYLALVAGALVWLPRLDWWPGSGRSSIPVAAPGARRHIQLTDFPSLGGTGNTSLFWGLLLLVAAQAISIWIEPFTMWSAAGWLPLALVLFAASQLRTSLAVLPWALLTAQLLGWLATGLSVERFSLVWQSGLTAAGPALLAYGACSALVYSGLACWGLRRGRTRSIWISLAVASPLCWLAVVYALATDLAVSPEWAVAAGWLALTYIVAGGLLTRSGSDTLASWMILGISGCYSLACAMVFRDAGLTLALAVQAPPLAWLAAWARAPVAKSMTKAVLAALVLRLTLNPWLPSYSESVGWTLWTYGGSALACLLASLLARPIPALQRWTGIVAAHLLVLASWAITRDILLDGEVFSADYSLTNASLNTAVWAGLGLVYHWRSRASAQMQGVYRWISRILLSMSLLNYGIVLVPLNPILTHDPVSSTPVWNLLLLAYGLPIALAWLAQRYAEPGARRVAGKVTAVALFAFASFEVRHLWQGNLDAIVPASDGEMATYSVVWLAMAVAAILAGGMRYGRGVYRAGMALLVLTVCKVFLADMSGLTGLLRAGSFLGLGLCLLALGYLHQRFAKVGARNAAEAN